VIEAGTAHADFVWVLTFPFGSPTAQNTNHLQYPHKQRSEGKFLPF
jgi:hypothetical protein